MIASIADDGSEEASADMHARRGCGGRNGRMITSAKLVYQPFQPSPAGLLCDGVSVQSIIERAGTPLYVYSAAAVGHAYRALDTAFASYPHAIHYALKANSTLAILRLLRSLG